MGRAQQVRQRQRERTSGLVVPRRRGVRPACQGRKEGKAREPWRARLCCGSCPSLPAVAVCAEQGPALLRQAGGRAGAARELCGGFVGHSPAAARRDTHRAQQPRARGTQRLTAARLLGPARHRSVRGMAKRGGGKAKHPLTHDQIL